MPRAGVYIRIGRPTLGDSWQPIDLLGVYEFGYHTTLFLSG